MYFKTELRNFFDFCKRHTWIRWLTSLQLMWWAGCQKFQWLKSYSWMKIKSQMSLFICIKRKWVQFSLSSLQQDQMLCLQLHDWQHSIKTSESLIMNLNIKISDQDWQERPRESRLAREARLINIDDHMTLRPRFTTKIDYMIMLRTHAVQSSTRKI